MKYVLDTNAVSALMRSDERVIARLSEVDRADVAVPQPVLAEIAYGIERLRSSKRRAALEERFQLLRSELPRAPWTDDVSDEFGRIKARLEKLGRRVEDLGAAVAAHAVAHEATLITANVRHIIRIPNLAIEDWSRPLE